MGLLAAENPFAELLAGKRVALVGGSPVWDREAAEARDLVVRLNNNHSHQGGRCDILYHEGSQVLPPALQLVPGLKFAQLNACQPGHQGLLELCHHHRIPVQLYTHAIYGGHSPLPSGEWCNRLGKILGTHPLTGVAAAYHLSLQPVAELFLTGFDFYALSSGLPSDRHSHKIEPQAAFLRALLKGDPRLSADPHLGEALGLPIQPVIA